MKKEIRHAFHINAAPEAVVDALTREEHIRNWWTKEARVKDGKGVFGWSGRGWTVELDMESDPGLRSVVWKCTRSNMQNTSAWEGTRIGFTLTPEPRGTRLDFAQTGYPESPCFDVCSYGWEFFLGTSLRQYIESGKGIPYPAIDEPRAA